MGGGCEGRATKKAELFLKIGKKIKKKIVATKLEVLIREAAKKYFFSSPATKRGVG